MMISSVCHTLWWQLGSGTDSSVSSSSGLALWLLENGAELNPRASVREDDAGRGDWGVEDAILTINPYVSHEEPRELALK